MATPSLLSAGLIVAVMLATPSWPATTPQTTATSLPRTPRLIMLKVMPALMYRTPQRLRTPKVTPATSVTPCTCAEEKSVAGEGSR